MSQILLAGASGMIGSKLIKKLKQKNYEIVLLSTQKKLSQRPDTRYWNPEFGVFPSLDLTSFEACINLCGAGIFDKRINKERKHKLSQSRLQPIEFLKTQLANQNYKIPHFISASAVGYYPSICLNELREDSTPGTGFIAELVKKWEETALSLSNEANRICLFRIGQVFSNSGGFLEQMARPMRWYLGALPGDGKQIISWIHIDDLCDMIIYALEKKLNGIYNAVAPQPETLETVAKQLALKLNRPLFLPPIPHFMLALLFGKERQELIASSQRVLSEKITASGFQFSYRTSSEAINQLY